MLFIDSFCILVSPVLGAGQGFSLIEESGIEDAAANVPREVEVSENGIDWNPATNEYGSVSVGENDPAINEDDIEMEVEPSRVEDPTVDERGIPIESEGENEDELVIDEGSAFGEDEREIVPVVERGGEILSVFEPEIKLEVISRDVAVISNTAGVVIDAEIIVIDSDIEEEEEISPPAENVSTIENDLATVRQEAIGLVDKELTDARIAITGYESELNMLRSSESTNFDRESFSLIALSKRLDKIKELDAEFERDFQQHRVGGLASMAALIRELKQLIELCGNELQRIDMGRVIRDLEKKRESIMTAPDRLIGSLRRAENLRVHREVGIDVARGLISEIENLVRQRRRITEEIDAVTQSIERERQRVPSLEDMRTEFSQRLSLFETNMRAEQCRLRLELDRIEAGPSRVSQPPVPPTFVASSQAPSRHTKSWRNSTRAERAEKRGKKRQSEPGSAKEMFRYFTRTIESDIASTTLLDSLADLGIHPARNHFVIGMYVQDSRRLIFRRRRVTVRTDNDKVVIVERSILNPLERFWLCVERWQWLQTLTPGVGVPGARAGTRIQNLAMDLRVPVQLATMYRNQRAEPYFYLPPASADLRTAEIEGKRRYREMWPEVESLEGPLGRADDSDEDEEISEEEETDALEE